MLVRLSRPALLIRDRHYDLGAGEPIAIGVARDIHAIDDLHTRCLKLCRALAHECDDSVAFALSCFVSSRPIPRLAPVITVIMISPYCIGLFG